MMQSWKASAPTFYPASSHVALLQHGHMPFSQAALRCIEWVMVVYISSLPEEEKTWLEDAGGQTSD